MENISFDQPSERLADQSYSRLERRLRHSSLFRRDFLILGSESTAEAFSISFSKFINFVFPSKLLQYLISCYPEILFVGGIVII